MQKIVPHLWFDKEAKEAAEFYTSLFPNSKVTNMTTLHNTPSGDCDIVSFELENYSFMAMSAGPLFKFNPSISFIIACETKEEVDTLWKELSQNGKALMALGEYPFSKWYGWTEDRYGLSWQIILSDEHYKYKQKITPTLMFVGGVAGKAEEAMQFYVSVFKNSKLGRIARYPDGMPARTTDAVQSGGPPEKEGTVMHGSVFLEGQEFFAMDSARMHDFKFNEAISLIINCKDQKEVDYYWERLSAVPESEQCGWLKDKYGVSWQVTPTAMGEMMSMGTEEQINRVTQAFLPMKKFDLAKLKKAYEG